MHNKKNKSRKKIKFHGQHLISVHLYCSMRYSSWLSEPLSIAVVTGNSTVTLEPASETGGWFCSVYEIQLRLEKCMYIIHVDDMNKKLC